MIMALVMDLLSASVTDLPVNVPTNMLGSRHSVLANSCSTAIYSSTMHSLRPAKKLWGRQLKHCADDEGIGARSTSQIRSQTQDYNNTVSTR